MQTLRNNLIMKVAFSLSFICHIWFHIWSPKGVLQDSLQLICTNNNCTHSFMQLVLMLVRWCKPQLALPIIQPNDVQPETSPRFGKKYRIYQEADADVCKSFYNFANITGTVWMGCWQSVVWIPVHKNNYILWKWLARFCSKFGAHCWTFPYHGMVASHF